MATTNVPVTYQGVRVGTAEVDEAGKVQMILAPGSPFGKNLIDAIASGLVDGFSIKPNVVPSRATMAVPKIVRNAGYHH